MPRDRTRPTMQDIADQVGVSKALVSLVIRKEPGPSPQTRDKVMAAAESLGYRINRTAALMTARRSHMIGVTAQIRNSFHAEVIEDIVAAGDRKGYEIVLGAVTPTRDESQVVETLLDLRCEGLLLVGPKLAAARLTKIGLRVPAVVVGRCISAHRLDVVRTADGRGIHAVVNHLASLGHRDIVHVDGGTGVIAADRRRGYRTAMRRHGLEAHARVVAGAFTEEAGVAAADTMLMGHLPTAVLCANDRIAQGVIDTLRRAGVEVPREISVTGYDDSPAARLGHIDLTTVSQTPRQQAEYADEAVAARLDQGFTDPIARVLEPKLVLRATTAAPVRRPSWSGAEA